MAKRCPYSLNCEWTNCKLQFEIVNFHPKIHYGLKFYGFRWNVINSPICGSLQFRFGVCNLSIEKKASEREIRLYTKSPYTHQWIPMLILCGVLFSFNIENADRRLSSFGTTNHADQSSLFPMKMLWEREVKNPKSGSFFTSQPYSCIVAHSRL